MGSSPSTQKGRVVVVGEAAVKMHRPSITSIAGTYTALEEAQKVTLTPGVDAGAPPMPATARSGKLAGEADGTAEKPTASAVRRLTREQKDFFIK